MWISANRQTRLRLRQFLAHDNRPSHVNRRQLRGPVSLLVKRVPRQRYTDGCRCDDCKDAQRIYQRRYRERSLSGDQNRYLSQMAQVQ
jgi:hypothetical protein